MPTQDPSSATPILDAEAAQSRKRLRKLIILVVLISVGVHLVAGIGAGIWVIARYFTQPKATFTIQKTVDMKPEERKHRLAMEEVAALRPKPVYNNRIQSLTPSKLALPELPNVPLDNIVPIDTEALISDQINDIGSAEGSGGGEDSFFGGLGGGDGLLEGRFYDLKQDADGGATGMDIGEYARFMKQFTRGAWRIPSQYKYKESSTPLYSKYFYFPAMEDVEGAKAFRTPNTGPGMWIAHYKGNFTAPEDGTYRLVGFGDNVLIVKIGTTLALDASDKNYTERRRDTLGTLRFSKGNAVTTPPLVSGPWITLRKGEVKPIEVVIGDEGGIFCGGLFIQKRDQPLELGQNNLPKLPLLFFSTPTENDRSMLSTHVPPEAFAGPHFRALKSSPQGLPR